MKSYKVKGNSNLIRDGRTNAIVNTNMTEYNNYMKLKKLKEEENKKVDKLENELIDLKNDLKEIKDLLRSLANGS